MHWWISDLFYNTLQWQECQNRSHRKNPPVPTVNNHIYIIVCLFSPHTSSIFFLYSSDLCLIIIGVCVQDQELKISPRKKSQNTEQ